MLLNNVEKVVETDASACPPKINKIVLAGGVMVKKWLNKINSIVSYSDLKKYGYILDSIDDKEIIDYHYDGLCLRLVGGTGESPDER